MKEKFKKLIIWLSKNKITVTAFAIGLGIGLIIMIATEDPEIAKLKNGEEPVVKLDNITITADNLYKDMKDYYSVIILLNTIDDLLLKDKYPDTGDVAKYVDDTINSYKTNYGEQFESALISSGYDSINAFRKTILLDYRRTLAVDDYLKSKVTDQEINDYYEKNVYGDTNTKHMLVKPDTTDSMTDEEKSKKETEALNLAKEIISKLDSGKTFDKVKEEYKDSITFEELGYKAYNASLEENYLKEMLNLKNNTYSKTPVKTSYGYHIVYRIDQKEKPELSTVKTTIIEEIVNDKKQNDSMIATSALFEFRESKNLNFIDSDLKEKYNEYKETTLTKTTES